MLHVVDAGAGKAGARVSVNGGGVGWRLLFAAVSVNAGADALNELLASRDHAALAAELVPRAVRVLQGHALAVERGGGGGVVNTATLHHTPSRKNALIL